MIKSYFVLNSLSRQFCLNVTQPTELSIPKCLESARAVLIFRDHVTQHICEPLSSTPLRGFEPRSQPFHELITLSPQGRILSGLNYKGIEKRVEKGF